MMLPASRIVAGRGLLLGARQDGPSPSTQSSVDEGLAAGRALKAGDHDQATGLHLPTLDEAPDSLSLDLYRLGPDEERPFGFPGVSPEVYKLSPPVAGSPRSRLRVEIKPGQRALLALGSGPDNPSGRGGLPHHRYTLLTEFVSRPITGPGGELPAGSRSTHR